MSQMILEYDEFCMFLLNIEVFNIMTPDFPYTSENETKTPYYIFACFIFIYSMSLGVRDSESCWFTKCFI
jgi:hypothetical protein